MIKAEKRKDANVWVTKLASKKAARYAHAAWFENASASTPVADKDQLTGSSGLNAKGC